MSIIDIMWKTIKEEFKFFFRSIFCFVLLRDFYRLIITIINYDHDTVIVRMIYIMQLITKWFIDEDVWL